MGGLQEEEIKILEHLIFFKVFKRTLTHGSGFFYGSDWQQ